LLLFFPTSLGLDPQRLVPVFLAGTLFYIGFTGLEPILPSLVSKASPGTAYGTALGLYNTVQFLGSTTGGSVAGALSNYVPEYTLLVLIVAAVIGFLLMLATPAQIQPSIGSRS
jgi:sugar phosphate permease